MATSVTQIRIDEDLKNQATAIFEELGLDFPTAVRMFLKRYPVQHDAAQAGIQSHQSSPRHGTAQPGGRKKRNL